MAAEVATKRPILKGLVCSEAHHGCIVEEGQPGRRRCYFRPKGKKAGSADWPAPLSIISTNSPRKPWCTLWTLHQDPGRHVYVIGEHIRYLGPMWGTARPERCQCFGSTLSCLVYLRTPCVSSHALTPNSRASNVAAKQTTMIFLLYNALTLRCDQRGVSLSEDGSERTVEAS